MSQSKVIVLVVAVVVLIGGAWWFMSMQGSSAPSGGNVPAAQNAQSNGALAPAQTSDASLNQSLSAVDAQMQSLNTDTASADRGLNDQPVPQN